MSTTVVETVTVTENQPQLARIQYVEPDLSVSPWDCDYFGLPKAKSIMYHTHELHDLRPSIFQSPSPYTLETHAFTAIKHKSLLHSPPHTISDFYSSTTLGDAYIPEVEALVKTVTGCSKVFTLVAVVRTKKADPPQKTAAERAANPSMEPERCGFKVDLSKLDFTKPMLPNVRDGKQSVAPVRTVHIDSSPRGARQVIRHQRIDILSEAQDIIAAEDAALASGKPYEGRRYAMYSVWRPLKTVKRDPLVLCDINSIVPERDLIECSNKSPGVNGDFLMGVYKLSAAFKEEQKWFWISEQKEDEVIFLQFYDNFAEREGRPVGVPHGSPELIGVESEEIRESIETRVMAFW